MRAGTRGRLERPSSARGKPSRTSDCWAGGVSPSGAGQPWRRRSWFGKLFSAADVPLGSVARSASSSNSHHPARRGRRGKTVLSSEGIPGRGGTSVGARSTPWRDCSRAAGEGDHVRPSRRRGGLPARGAPDRLGAAFGNRASVAPRGRGGRPDRLAGGGRRRTAAASQVGRSDVPERSSSDGLAQLDSEHAGPASQSGTGRGPRLSVGDGPVRPGHRTPKPSLGGGVGDLRHNIRSGRRRGAGSSP
jgi:hypothetical protein